MHMNTLLATVALIGSVASRSLQHVGRPEIRDTNYLARRQAEMSSHELIQERESMDNAHLEKRYTRPGKTIIPQNSNTTKFGVNGRGLPLVNFDIGESYAGLLSISNDPKDKDQLYYWFFPSSNPLAGDEITIWLNGGPGCSSLEGLFQENGVVNWQYGTYQPVYNPWNWVNLTNMIWVEYPQNTGFSQGTPPTDEVEAAKQFLGFFKNFVDTFNLHKRKIYITGESYAGFYVPYIADEMFKNGNKDYYDVQAIQINDPSTSYSAVQNDIPAVPFVDYHQNLFHLNDTYMNYIRQQDKACGYAEFREKYFVFPPAPGGHYPAPPNNSDPSCQVYNDIFNAVTLINPCFDLYQVATTCPILYDVLGFPGSFEYLPAGANIYFNRTDVQRAINAPLQPWAECVNDVLPNDPSPYSGLSVLPGVIEKTKRTLIAHGQLDFVLIDNGTLLMIQNMTFNGGQGFSQYPKQPFYVPYATGTSVETLAGAGQFGNWHTERGLTYVSTWLSGHMIPQYAPSAAYRQLEFLLGRIDNLGVKSDFTTQKGNYGN